MSLDRPAVMKRLELMPEQYQEDTIDQLDAQYIVQNGYPGDRLEVQLCLIEEALVRWYRMESDVFMNKFMKGFDFTWEDVRNLKTVKFSDQSENYRNILVNFFHLDGTDENLTDFWSAMRLIEDWLRKAAASFDDCDPEFVLAAGIIVSHSPRVCAEQCLVGQFIARRVIKLKAIQAAICSGALVFLSLSLSLLFGVRIFGFVMALVCFLVAYALFAFVWSLPNRVEHILSLGSPGPKE